MSFILIPALKINYPKPSVTQNEPQLGPGEFSEIANFSEDFEDGGWSTP